MVTHYHVKLPFDLSQYINKEVCITEKGDKITIDTNCKCNRIMVIPEEEMPIEKERRRAEELKRKE